MLKAKRWAPPKVRAGPKSIERTRVRELEQSRVGFDAERSRIKTKYRTRMTRAKRKLEQEVQSNKISREVSEEKLKACRSQLIKKRDEKLEAVAYEWYQLVYADEMESEWEYSNEEINEKDYSKHINIDDEISENADSNDDSEHQEKLQDDSEIEYFESIRL